MRLKAGDVVEFKKYEDMSNYERAGIGNVFPEFGKVRKVIMDNEKVIYFYIEGSPYGFSDKSIARVTCQENHILKEMKLKVGDVVEFKKYEDMPYKENLGIPEYKFPKFGKVRKVAVIDEKVVCFFIEGSSYGFCTQSVVRVISDVDDVDISSLNPGDEVLVKATVNGFLQIEPSVDKRDVVKILKRKIPEHFIVKEKLYGLYIGGSGDLVSNKDRAKIYASRDDANAGAADMRISGWSVIPYDD